jgi:hypothetical protein
MTKPHLVKIILLSLAAIILVFLGFWGFCLLAAIVKGRPIQGAFTHKLIFLMVTSALQTGMIASRFIRNRFYLWLRLCTIAGAVIYYGIASWIELENLRLLDRNSGYLWMALTTVFAVLVCSRLMPVLRRRMSLASQARIS